MLLLWLGGDLEDGRDAGNAALIKGVLSGSWHHHVVWSSSEVRGTTQDVAMRLPGAAHRLRLQGMEWARYDEIGIQGLIRNICSLTS